MLKKIFSVIKIIRPLNVTSSGIAILFSSKIAAYQGSTSNVLLAVFVVIFFTIGANVLNDFFDYEAKYEGKHKEVTPANINLDLENKLKTEAKKIYKVLKLSGFSRIDFIVKNQLPYFLEINTTPGMTEHSIFPKQVRFNNLNMTDLFTEMIQNSLK